MDDVESSSVIGLMLIVRIFGRLASRCFSEEANKNWKKFTVQWEFREIAERVQVPNYIENVRETTKW